MLLIMVKIIKKLRRFFVNKAVKELLENLLGHDSLDGDRDECVTLLLLSINEIINIIIKFQGERKEKIIQPRRPDNQHFI